MTSPFPNFDADGFLPPGRYEADLAGLREVAISRFPDAKRRREVYLNFNLHMQSLVQLGIPVLSRWVDGSFVSAKAEPGDVDVVYAIDGPAFDALPQHTRQAASQLLAGHATRDQTGVDAFALFVYPQGHAKQKLTTKQQKYWERKWGHDDRVGKDKGYLEVKP